MMSEIVSLLGMENAAEQILLEGLKHHGRDVVLTNALANYYYRSDQAEKGLALLAPLAGKNSPDGLLLTLANLQKAAGEAEKARAIYESLLAHDSKNTA